MSARDHEAIETLLAVDVLDGLDGEDRAWLVRLRAAHGDCPECRAIETGFRDAAALLAASLEPVAPPTGGADAIVGGKTGPERVRPRHDLGAHPRTRSRGWMVLTAAAALLLLVTSVTVFGRRTQPVTLADWSQRVVHFDGSAGELAMAYAPGEAGVAFWGQDLPDPGAGKTFEIWMIEDGTPIPGGCVTPTDGNVAVYVDADVGTSDTMAVTVEPTTCPVEPTGDHVLSAQL